MALIAVVTLPILLGEPLLPRAIEPGPAVADLYEAIESLGQDASVLVAFDYDPTTSGEMDVVTRAIVGHLMEREARLVVISLLPAGPATAQALLGEMAEARPAYADGYGQTYVVLGFLPGQAAAVRLLSQSVGMALPRDFQGTLTTDLPIMGDYATIQDFDLVVELAADRDSLRWWIEQAGAPSGVPLAAGVSAAIEPVAQTYYESEPRQLVGLAAGIPGAAMYEELAGGGSAETATAARLDGQLGGHLIFILVLLIGGGVYLVRRGTGRQQ